MNDQTGIFASCLRACWLDDGYKRRFIDDPRSILESHGLLVSDDLEIRALENTESRAHFFLPGPPDRHRALSDAALFDLAKRSSWRVIDACHARTRFLLTPPWWVLPVAWRSDTGGERGDAADREQTSDADKKRRLVELLAACWRDDDLRNEFLETPMQVLERFGVDSSERIPLRGVEVRDGVVHVVLPAPPAGWRTMSEEALLDSAELGSRRVTDASDPEDRIVWAPKWWKIPVVTVRTILPN